MSEHPWERIARRAWDAVSKSDVDALADVLAEDAVWHATGRGSHAGDYNGRAEIFDYLAGVGEDAERFDSTIDDVLVGKRYAAILFDVEGDRKGRSLSVGFVIVLRIEGERIAEVWSVPRDQLAVDEFWA
jgi:ketosteroid isomerase-like protein